MSPDHLVKPDPTISEVIARGRKLEYSISKLVADFADATGVRVDSLVLETIPTGMSGDPTKVIYSVRVLVKPF